MTAAAMPVTDEQRFVLERLEHSKSSPHRHVMKARGLLLACDSVANEETALWRELGCGAPLEFGFC
jgi:hypothetical protein